METPNERELAFHKCDVCGMSKQMQCLSQLKDETYVACDNECDISAIQEMRHILDFLKCDIHRIVQNATYIAFNTYRFAVQVDVRRGDSKCDVCGILPMRCIRHVDTDAMYIAMKR